MNTTFRVAVVTGALAALAAGGVAEFAGEPEDPSRASEQEVREDHERPDVEEATVEAPSEGCPEAVIYRPGADVTVAATAPRWDEGAIISVGVWTDDPDIDPRTAVVEAFTLAGLDVRIRWLDEAPGDALPEGFDVVLSVSDEMRGRDDPLDVTLAKAGTEITSALVSVAPDATPIARVLRHGAARAVGAPPLTKAGSMLTHRIPEGAISWTERDRTVLWELGPYASC